jgi:hypothetical protein
MMIVENESLWARFAEKVSRFGRVLYCRLSRFGRKSESVWARAESQKPMRRSDNSRFCHPPS